MKSKTTITSYVLYLFTLLLVLSVNKTIAQDKGIFELSNSEASSSTVKRSFSKTKRSKTSTNSNRNDFYELAFKLHPTAYLNKKHIKKSGNSKTIVKVNMKGASGINKLNNLDSRSNIEMFDITLASRNDLNSKLDLTTISGFNNLKYIYIKCYFECSASDISNFIKINPNSNVRVFYKTETPS